MNRQSHFTMNHKDPTHTNHKVISFCILVLTQSNLYGQRGKLFTKGNLIAHSNVHPKPNYKVIRLEVTYTHDACFLGRVHIHKQWTFKN